MADYSYTGRNKKAGVRFNNDAKNGDGWNGPGYFSKVEAHHEFLRGPSINGADGGRGGTTTTSERPPNHIHQSLFGKAAAEKLQAGGENAYRPPRQTGMYTREYVFGSKRISEPPLGTSDGWTRPSRAGWPVPPPDQAPLGKVTDDVQAAANYLKGFLRPSATAALFGGDHKSSAYSPPVTTTSMYGDRRSSAYDPPVTTSNIYGDRKSSAYDPAVTTNMYGGDRRSSAYDPPVTANMYGGDRSSRSSAYSPPAYEGRRDQSGITPTIDSKEAARKYGGQFIW